MTGFPYQPFEHSTQATSFLDGDEVVSIDAPALICQSLVPFLL